jgi:tetratricopeptide (TPR) repeat protein
MALARAAEGTITRVKRPQLAASLELYRGSILFAQGKVDDALAAYRRALADYQAMPAERLSLARTYNNMSLVEGDAGQDQDALDHAKQAYAIYAAEHPDTLTIRVNIAMAEQRLGQVDAAREHYHEAIAAIERTFGPEHGHLAAPLSNLAALEADAGKLDVSLALAQRARSRDAPEAARRRQRGGRLVARFPRVGAGGAGRLRRRACRCEARGGDPRGEARQGPSRSRRAACGDRRVLSQAVTPTAPARAPVTPARPS